MNLLNLALFVVLPGAPQMYVRDQAVASTLKVISNCTDISVTAVNTDIDTVFGQVRQLEPFGVK
jgi:hypothetical protein